MIPRDKILHYIAGFVIGLSALIIPSWYAFGLVVLAGVAKEAYDEYKNIISEHTVGWDSLDLLFTVAGGIVSVGIIEVIT